MIRLFKIRALAICVTLIMTGSVIAAPLSLKRGLNLDIWDSWPAEERWTDRGVLLPFPEWQRKLDTDDLIELRHAGFDFIRLPVDPTPLLSPTTEPYRDAIYASVLEAVHKVVAADLKVVVDLHAFPSGGRSSGSDLLARDPGLFDRYVDVVRRLARVLGKEDPAKVALELMNEPLAGCDSNEQAWAAMQKRLFEAARASATRLTLVLTGGCWSDAESLTKLDPAAIPDDNILWTFHSYAPFVLTHQGASWAGDFIRYVTGIPYPPHGANAAVRDAARLAIRQRIKREAPFTRRAGMLDYLDELLAEIDTPERMTAMMSEPFARVRQWADANGISRDRILLGEFGMIRQEYGTPQIMDPVWRAAYVSDMIRLAEDSGFSWSIWGYGGAFGIVESFSGRRAETDVLDVVRQLDRP